MIKAFGKTWWGTQWLNALSNIAFGNRLARGSAYARKGAVLYSSIQGNTIKGMVQDTKQRPKRSRAKNRTQKVYYNAEITIPAFSEEDIQKLVKAIAEKPLIVSKLINRNLDPELLRISADLELRLFPKQFSDLQMQCSCQDYAIPCKHLAAVIYKTSVEIDNDPFLVFKLHGIDLKAELEKENIMSDTGDMIPILKELLEPRNTKPVPVNGEREEEVDKGDVQQPQHEQHLPNPTHVPFSPEPTFHNTQPRRRDLVFTTLTPVLDSLLQLLTDNPPFYHGGNFKEKYLVIMKKVVRNAQRIITGKIGISEYFGTPDVETDARRRNYGRALFTITPQANVQLAIDGNNQVAIWVDNRKQYFSLKQFILQLWQVPMSQIKDYHPTVEACKTSLLCALNILANGAVVPQIVQLDNKSNTLRMIPAIISKDVKVLVEKLEETMPSCIIMLQETTYPYTLDKEHRPLVSNTAFTLLSIWLKALIIELAQIGKGDLITNFFFTNNHAYFSGSQQALSAGICNWLQRYHLTQENYKPVIVVKELKNECFQVFVSIQKNDKPFKKPVSVRRIFALKKFEAVRYKILQTLSQLSCFIPGLDEYINSKGEVEIKMDIVAFTPFLMDAIPAIQLLNIDILLPKSLQHILRPKPSIRVRQKSQEGKSFMRLDHLLDFDWQVAIGNTVLDEYDFSKLMKNSEGLIRYKASYIYVNHSDLEKLHKHFTASKQLTAFDMLRAALSDDYYGASVGLTNDVKQLIKELTEQKEIPLPQGINATLRPYQQRGYSWLYRNTKTGFGSVIADDMGLGKTVQVITTLLKYKEEGSLENDKALVIAPTGLLTNWQAEIEKFAPALKYHIYHGIDRELDSEHDYDVLITSYGIARRDADKLKKLRWFVVITDEAQNIKNHDTGQSKAIKSIPSRTFIAMSGTPVENRLSELWSIMDFSNRGFLGSLTDFKENFASPIQNQNDVAVAEKLKTITSPFLMRRLKCDKSIISDLPDKIEIDSFCHLVKEQASLYQSTLNKAMQEIAAIEPINQQSLFVRQGLVLQMILALKQICNHPTQFLKNNIPDASLSGKLELMFDKLETILENNEKVLIFTQFTEMGNLLQQFISERFGTTPLYYHGGCTLSQRTAMVDRFQTNYSDNIFILSLKAGGTGLNLTAASQVIHYDLWWNPAVETQATDRAYRIGQKSNVMVHRLITKGTFEERINEMMQSKKALANLTVATGESWIGNMSNNELKEIFELGVG